MVMKSEEYEEYCGVGVDEEMDWGYGDCYENVLIEFIVMFDWWNGLVWKVRYEVNGVDEYEGDEGVLNEGMDVKRYELLLVRKGVG